MHTLSRIHERLSLLSKQAESDPTKLAVVSCMTSSLSAVPHIIFLQFLHIPETIVSS
jgi:hypothetical protein